MKRSRLMFRLLPLAAACIAAPALATNGYMPHGHGMKAQGMGGAGLAMAQDAMAAADNPANMALLGNRIDFGLEWFRPTRSAEIVGNAAPAGVNGKYNGNDRRNFFIPDFGYNTMVNPDLSFGVSVFGHGGMNTNYSTPIPLFGTSEAGVDLSQLFVSPSVAYKLAPNHAVGLALNIAYQRFKATGLENFTAPSGPQQFSAFPGNVTNRGYDNSFGAGVTVGYTGQFTPEFAVGLMYRSRTQMQKFDKYKGLFAGGGSFDIPAKYGAGIAFTPMPGLTLAADVMRIDYSSVNSINNPLLPNLFQAPLGTKGGAGFAWRDVTAYKFGVDWAMNRTLSLRAGYNHGNQPIPASDTLFNILAPGTVKDHYTAGATWTLANKAELTLAFMYAPTERVRGVNSIPAPFGGGNANIQLKETSLGIGYGWKF